MAAGLLGSGRVRRHPHHRHRSAPQCGVSGGPRAFGSGSPAPAPAGWPARSASTHRKSDVRARSRPDQRGVSSSSVAADTMARNSSRTSAWCRLSGRIGAAPTKALRRHAGRACDSTHDRCVAFECDVALSRSPIVAAARWSYNRDSLSSPPSDCGALSGAPSCGPWRKSDSCRLEPWAWSGERDYWTGVARHRRHCA
jgi:hypothetical protein